MLNRVTLHKLAKQVKQLICIKVILLLQYFLVPSTIYSSNNEMEELKCDSGANPGQVKRWQYNHKDLIEIYPNGYRRVYDIKSINEEKILADENAVRGLYFVSIHFNRISIDVKVSTPLVKYIDKNCKKISR